MAAAKQRLEFGGYYLLDPAFNGKTPYYGVAWYDAANRQRRTKSTGETDAGKAYAFMLRYAGAHPLAIAPQEVEGTPRGGAIQNLKDATAKVQGFLDALNERAAEVVATATMRKIKPADDLTIKVVAAAYSAWRPELANKTRPAETLQDVQDVFGEEVTVTQFDGPMQHAFLKNRRSLLNKHTGARRYADNTVLTRVSCLWSMMHCCANEIGILKPQSIPARIGIDTWRPLIQLGKRRLKNFALDKLVRFIVASFACDRWLRNSIICTGLAPRPDDAADLQRAQIDLDHRLADLRPLRPDGTPEPETNKRSAVVKFGPTMARWFAYWDEQDKQRPGWNDPHYVLHQGRRMDSFTWVHRVARRAGFELPHGMGAYVFRHFMASYLVSRGCPIDQVKMLLGHIVVDGATAYYVELDPGFMARVAELIEELWHEVERRLPKGMSILTPWTAPEEPDQKSIVLLDDEAFGDGTLEDQPEPEDDGMDVWELPGRTATRRGTLVAHEPDNVSRILTLEASGASWERT